MTQIPADAQRSDDGQWWWDGSQWQPVGDQSGAAGGGGAGGGGGGAAGAAEFGFDNNGLIIQVDQSDNPDTHVTLHVNAGTEAVFTVCNMGSAAGTASVTIYVDDLQVQTWTSGSVEAGQCEGANVSGCGRHPVGSHAFRAVVTPGHSGNDEATNTVDIDDQ
jgi:hypothetical protein